ncbi:hypothetical protein [Streptomyces sp. OE57]|uniref:hypothetical protein n=1 Tax=Streptomyces lacaronensis TaxID=3379885 RepID=UPI0039B77D87
MRNAAGDVVSGLVGAEWIGQGRNRQKRGSRGGRASRFDPVDHRALVSYGEIAPGSGNQGAILAVGQYGPPPARPRLVVTGEVTGGRDVNDVVELDVVRVEPTG